MYSLNIVLLSFRSTDLAKRLTDVACDAAQKLKGVSISLGYGGSDEEHIRYIQRRFVEIAKHGGEAQLFRHVDVGARLERCVASEKRWTLFLSDDDEFSPNFLPSIADTSRDAGANVTMITPTEYWIMDGETRTKVISPPTLEGDLAERYKEMFKAELPWWCYYAAHRTATIHEWLLYLRCRSYVPSYVDQLLVTMSVLAGTTIQTTAKTYFTKENSNWKDFKAVTLSHANWYPCRELTLFHELFLSSDMYSILRNKPYFQEIAVVHFKRWNWNLSHTFKTMLRRASALNIKINLWQVWWLFKLAISMPRMWMDWDRITPNRGADRITELARQIERKMCPEKIIS